MRNLLGLGLLLFMSGCSLWAPQTSTGSKDPAQWFSCEKSSDCVLLSGSSCTSPLSINAMFAGLYSQAHAKDKLCGPAGYEPQKVAYAVCVKKRCAVRFRPARSH